MSESSAMNLLRIQGELHMERATRSAAHLRPDLFDNLHREETRLESFRDWSVTEVDKALLARQGFYLYPLTTDMCKCLYCGIIFCEFAESNVYKHHRQQAPFCLLTLGLETNNIQIENVEVSLTCMSLTMNDNYTRERERYEMMDIINELNYASREISHYIAENDGPTVRFGMSIPNATNSARPPSPQSSRTRTRSPQPSTSSLSDPRATQTQSDDSVLCKICYSRNFDCIFIPCNHLIACKECAARIKLCPACRLPFDSVLDIFVL